MRSAFQPERVGLLVHGYGVAHAHLIVVPQNGPQHLTSDRFATIESGKIAFAMSIPSADRAVLDTQAQILSRAI